jgi:uncharacterized RmlC-like cupin family protein
MPEKESSRQVVAVRAEHEVMTRQRLPYFVGVSAATAGAKGLSMHMVVIPPGARAEHATTPTSRNASSHIM